MPDFLVSKNAKEDKQVLEKLCGKELSDQEAFEAEQDLLGAFAWLLEMDEKQKARREHENN
jgi:hypothetical protein